MLIILISIAYGELIWHLIKSGKRSYKDMDKMMKFIVGFNYVAAILVGSGINLIFGVVCSLYQLVIFKMRIEDLD